MIYEFLKTTWMEIFVSKLGIDSRKSLFDALPFLPKINIVWGQFLCSTPERLLVRGSCQRSHKIQVNLSIKSFGHDRILMVSFLLGVKYLHITIKIQVSSLLFFFSNVRTETSINQYYTILKCYNSYTRQKNCKRRFKYQEIITL